MTSNVPIVRQIAWISTIPQLIIIGLITYVFYLLEFEDPFIFGIFSYLILSVALRNLAAKYQRQGMKLVKQQQFALAIPFFEQSVDFFTRNSWIDNYRFLTLLSSSRMTYREMGLCNIAFCNSQIGNGQKAKDYYEMVLIEFPNNGLAKAGLNMFNSI